MKKIFILAAIAILAGGAATYSLARQKDVTNEKAGESLLGGDRDEHGCIGSAGYSWCEAKQKCLRIWEESCQN